MKTILFVAFIVMATATLAASDLYDYNGDGSVTLVDARVLQQVIDGERSCPGGKACDVDENGIVEDADKRAFGTKVKEAYAGPSKIGDKIETSEKIKKGELQTLDSGDFGKRALIKMYEGVTFEDRNYTLWYLGYNLVCKEKPCKPITFEINDAEYKTKEGGQIDVGDIRIKVEKINNDNNTIVMFYDMAKEAEEIADEIKKEDKIEEKVENKTASCEGCEHKGRCFSIGERNETQRVFCGIDKKIQVLTANGEICDSDYECEKGTCVNKTCSFKEVNLKTEEGSQNIFVRFFVWVMGWFV